MRAWVSASRLGEATVGAAVGASVAVGSGFGAAQAESQKRKTKIPPLRRKEREEKRNLTFFRRVIGVVDAQRCFSRSDPWGLVLRPVSSARYCSPHTCRRPGRH